MVSFQALLSPTQRETIVRDDYEFEINSPKKRKRVEPPVEGKFGKTMFDKEIHLQTPLPSEWQRCLDIKSGEIHYLNTNTQKRTTKDPRTILEQPINQVSLNLELNLPCGSLNQHFGINKTVFPSLSSTHFDKTNLPSNTFFENRRTISKELTLFPSRSENFEVEKCDDDDKREMVTAVCMKCHMLVMMCKSSPSCPNCKFMHPIDQKAPALLNQSLSLFC